MTVLPAYSTKRAAWRKFNKIAMLFFWKGSMKESIKRTEKIKCEHIWGYEFGVDESWLIYDPAKAFNNPEYWGVIFNFCPLCGVKLRNNNE